MVSELRLKIFRKAKDYRAHKMKTKGISIASGVNWKVINSFLIEDMLVCGFPIRKYSIMKFSFRKKKIFDNYTFSLLYENTRRNFD